MKIEGLGPVVLGINRERENRHFRSHRPHCRIPQQRGSQLTAEIGAIDGQPAKTGNRHRKISRQVGVSRQSLSELLNGRKGVSADMAIRLEKAGWSNAETWLGVRRSKYNRIAWLERRRRWPRASESEALPAPQ